MEMENAAPLKKRRGGNVSSGFAAFIPLVGFLFFGIIPLAMSAVISFTELHTADFSTMKFVGFRNYLDIILNRDGFTYNSYFSTFMYLLNVPLCMALSIAVSFLISRTKFGKKFFRSVFFVPYVCSTVVVTLTFRNLMFATDGGILNYFLDKLGFEKVEWLSSSPWLFMLCSIIISVWKGLGWCIVLYQAAMVNVDQVYYEAAAIDGASPLQQFWNITWHAISPTTAYILIIKLMGSIQEVEMMMMLTRGGNNGVPVWPFGGSNAWVSDTVVKQIYNMFYESPYTWGFGVASAAGWVLAIIIFIITRLVMKSQEKWVSYDF